MKSPLLRTGILLAALMFGATVLAVVMRPSHKIADQGQKIDLEAMIPKRFGEWRMVEERDRQMISPEVLAKLDRIYNQILSRIYVDGKGARVMLSIAYGSDQSDSMSVHLPEVCYPSQGFEMLKKSTGRLGLGDASIPVKRLVARQGRRIEPITYWITVGDRAVAGRLDRKLAQVRFGLTGSVPDGMLVRVSSIDADSETAHAMHAGFIKDMYASMGRVERDRLFGVNG
ncbi:MAG: EpsI family protein [Candidatus Nitricoxidivorans perseverans]|uniref:EpsI family protein n=1 Tax=Candidatus Nitricoxidivorans perseverans TaxID=2975601 RepID=A0AA49FL98_9PROT|nr:MAG: EpsI family protein [Candidatus Nitricoxidivorans perseverans]